MNKQELLLPKLWKKGQEFFKVEYPILAGGLPPRQAITRIKRKGCRLICFAPTVGVARRLISLGVDALVIEGHEAGGHIGPVSTGVLAGQSVGLVDEIQPVKEIIRKLIDEALHELRRLSKLAG